MFLSASQKHSSGTTGVPADVIGVCRQGESLREFVHLKHFTIGIAGTLCLSVCCVLQGQSATPLDYLSSARSASSIPDIGSLPDEPQPQGEASGESLSSKPSGAPVRNRRYAPKPLAPLYNKYIEPEQRAQPLVGLDEKLRFGVHQIASPYFLLAVVGAAGYEHFLDDSPNYGTNGKAFAQRMGAAAARNASQSLFTDGLMPALLHQDPRYYVLGKRHNTFARGTYAISRIFVTRSDGGRSVPNYSLFTGHAETVLLQNAYYPDVNRNFKENAQGYADSFGGVALSNVVREFFPDLLRFVHLE